MNAQDLNDFLKETNESSPGFQDIYSRSVEFCGRRRSHITVNGSVKVSIFPCNKWRECENCYQRRILEFKTRLSSVPEDTVVILVENDVAAKLLRKRQITADDYFRSPYNDNTVLIAISQEVLDNVKFDNYVQKLELIDGVEFNEATVKAFVDIPSGCRTSGNLGKPEKREDKVQYDLPIDDDDIVIIEELTYLTDHNNDESPASLFLKATIETSTDAHKLLPYPELYKERCNAYESLLKESNVSYNVLQRKSVTVSKRWLKQNFLFINEDVKITYNIPINVMKTDYSRTFYSEVSSLLRQNNSELVMIC